MTAAHAQALMRIVGYRQNNLQAPTVEAFERIAMDGLGIKHGVAAGVTIVPAATLAAKDAEIERLKANVAHLTDLDQVADDMWRERAEIAESALEAERRKGEALRKALKPLIKAIRFGGGQVFIGWGDLLKIRNAYRAGQDTAPEASQAAQRSGKTEGGE